MTTEYYFTKFGDNYEEIDGIKSYIRKLNEEDPTHNDSLRLIQNLRNTPTAYLYVIEAFLKGVNIANFESKTNSALLNPDGGNIITLLKHDNLTLNNLLEICVREDADRYIRVKNPQEAHDEFKARMREKEHALYNPYKESVFVPTYDEELKADFDKRRINNYKDYMKELKARDPEEYKRMTALHKEYKNENAQLEKLYKKRAQLEEEIERYCDENELAWFDEEVTERFKDRQIALTREIVDAKFKFQQKNEERFKSGIISEQHREMRRYGLHVEDTVGLPMRNWNETMYAKQALFVDLGEDAWPMYANEDVFFNCSEVDDVVLAKPHDDPERIRIMNRAREILHEREDAARREREAVRGNAMQVVAQVAERGAAQTAEANARPVNFQERGINISQRPIQRVEQNNSERENVAESRTLDENKEISIDDDK